MMSRITQRELERRLADAAGLSKDEIARTLAALGEIILASAADGRSVQLPGVGSLQPADRRERRARNPRTGQEMLVPAKRTLRLRLSAAAGRFLNEGDG